MDWGNIFGNTAGGAMTGASLGPWGALIGGGLGLAGSLIGGSPNEKAEDQSKKYWDEAKGYQQPYAQHGLDQYDRLNQATNDMLNPEGLENKWAAGYKNSPYAQQLLSQNQSSGMDAASAMGLGGSSAALGNIQQGAGNIVSADRQQYMNDLMEKYMQGIGLGKGLYGVGAGTAGDLGKSAMLHGDTMAGLAYNKANQPMNTLASGAGTLLSNYLGKDTGPTMQGAWKGFLS